MDTSFFGIGLPELIFIVVIALIVLGPERLPSTMREIAKMWGYVRNLSRELTSQFGDELKALDDINPQKLMREMVETAEKEAKEHMDGLKSITTTKTTTTVTMASATASPTAPVTEAEATVKSMTTETTVETTVVSEVPADTAPSVVIDSTATPVEEAENRILPPVLDHNNGVTTEPPVDDPVLGSQLITHATAVSLNGSAAQQENIV